ncbi:hypothetical protein TRICI_006569 [Trichomonascus ciferrii]|uniref:AB hydrolase-1 domain-containing protein n=1 Tax=Trichomonascus ciferrii TaxID=44093 RepID=A0A642UG57_9ASCO|nr:hypothetical protein TRICI_006569 [Trichomonascus ciferrii]
MILRRGLVQQLRAVSGRRGYGSVADAYSKDIPTVELAYERFDPKKGRVEEDPIVFLHGLFGSKINNKTVSKVLARDLQKSVYCLDLRNHGESPHVARHDYPALSADVENFLDEQKIESCILVGHSMGAKAAMAVSLRRPGLVSSLIPVDNAPIDARLTSAFPLYVRGMKDVERSQPKSQKEAVEVMQKYEPSLPIVQFLLANLKKHDDGSYRFRIPLDTLGKSLDNLGDFPFHPDTSRFVKPTMFIRGTKSP